ncbi:MAG: DnaK suppressor protein [Candidatus Binatia bacterium]|jgi:DnaK suppressor protein
MFTLSFTQMNPNRIKYFKQKLEELKAELEVAIKSNTEDSAIVSMEQSIGRIARMEAIYSQQTSMELKQRQRDRLKAVIRSLDKIEDDRYGICARCKTPINEERLEIQPEAGICVKCAEGAN